MLSKTILSVVAVACILVFGVTARAQVVIETVTVGNPGNAGEQSRLEGWGDPTYYGGVHYIYNIGKYEVTAGQYVEFLNAVAATDTYGLYNPFMDIFADGCQITQHGTSGNFTYDFSGRPSGTEADWADRPVNYVCWGDAARFCNWLHNGQPTGAQDLNTTEDGSYYLNGATSDAALLAVVREPDATWFIASEDEWYKAAYHYNDGVTGNYYDYPTSSDSVPSNDLIDPDPGNNANFYDNDATIGAPYHRTDVGEFENSESPYGTFDQGGNLREWNEAVIASSSRGTRGGSFGSTGNNLHAAWRHGFNPTEEGGTFGQFIGFRVANVSAYFCGDGLIRGDEECDDNNTDDGDGCSSTCIIEPGWQCTGEPSVCSFCGDGVIDGYEECDDGNTEPGDGCSDSCTIEDGWECTSQPSVCVFTCGDGLIDDHEECDDGNTDSGDGCSSVCTVEVYWECTGEPSTCRLIVPAVSEWGLVVMTLLVVAAGTVVLRRRREVHCI